MRRAGGAWGALLLLLTAMALSAGCVEHTPGGGEQGRVPMAVLGDSNSHSYQDRVSFPPGSGERGGAHRARTFQWTEVLARLRPEAIDPGPWEASGHSKPWVYLRSLIGLPEPRAPRKEDYRFNFANSGAGCSALAQGLYHQVPHLLAEMATAPDRWAHGVVVLRISNVDFGGADFLDALAADAAAPEPNAVIDRCVRHIDRAVANIRAAQPAVHIVLVGTFDEAHDPLDFERVKTRAALDNVAHGMDRFDNALRGIVKRTPGTSFFDDRAWFRGLWGGRAADGTPAYRTVRIGDRLAVSNSLGDGPEHALLADDHAGLVWNTLWAQALSQHLHDQAHLPVAPITDEEVRRFVLGLLG